jgi:eukaryotic-like serine/threonine-protein kinase
MHSVTAPGHVVAGRYELLDVIGHGAMGTVWRARDNVLAREVAVKEVCLPALMSPQDRAVARERSLREARVAARLTHPGVVTVYDVIEAEGSPWIVMELVRARSLARVLAEDGPMPPARAAELGMGLLEALGSAHAAGIVHRDVKPGNVLVPADGRAVLTDFGIATVAGDQPLTQAGMVMGTPGFCAPERIRGAPASPASDLWSLGATLYAAVEGRAPFDGQGSAMAVLANIVHADPPPAGSAGPLGPVIAALMSRDPAARPDAAAARRMLTGACGDGQPGKPAGARQAAPAGDGKGTPAMARQAAPAGDRNGAPAQDRKGAPAQDREGAPAQDRKGAPAGNRKGAPAGDGTIAFPGGQPRRPGRHRRGLLLGGGGATAK